MNYRGNILGFAAGEPLSRHDFKAGFQAEKMLAIDLHVHHHLEIIFVLEGEYRFGTDQFEDIFHAGDVFIVNSMEPHWGWCYFRPNSRNSYSFLMLEPDQLPRGFHEALDEVIESGITFVNRIPADAAKESGVFELGTRLLRSCNSAAGCSSLNTMGLALQFLDALRGFRRKTAEDAAEENDFVARTMKYLEEHYAEPLTLEQVAGEIGYEKTYFCRKFQQEFHWTFIQYLHRFRMKKFTSHPALDQQTIARCAHEVGYLNYGTFHKVFRKIYGIAPRDYIAKRT